MSDRLSDNELIEERSILRGQLNSRDREIIDLEKENAELKSIIKAKQYIDERKKADVLSKRRLKYAK